MHEALLIDEILRQIFHFCSRDDRPSLVAAARSCRAWKDPSLDLVWDRLPSFAPLLSLLPKHLPLINEPSSRNDINTFHSYARRVKHISQRQEVTISPSIAATISALSHPMTVLSGLRTAYISLPRSNALLIPLHLTPSLRHLDIDLGFKASSSLVDATLCQFLERTNVVCPGLTQVSLRGLASERLNCIISSMRNLHVLSLRLGRSLLPSTLNAIMTFPTLRELEVHAGHLSSTDLAKHDDSLTVSLKKLHARAKPPFLETLFSHIEPNTLEHLHIEIEDHTPHPWDIIFSSIRDKASNTLFHLALEHHFELQESASFTSSDPTQDDTTAHIASSLHFKTMESLSTLSHLRHFSCDVTLPPVLGDQDMEKLISWWPEIEHLEMGPAPQTDQDDDNVASRLTIASLSCIAAKCVSLKKLILPLIVEDVPLLPDVSNNRCSSNLQNLTIAQLNTSTPSELAEYLRHIFPRLQAFDGPCDDGQVWIDIRHILQSGLQS